MPGWREKPLKEFKAATFNARIEGVEEGKSMSRSAFVRRRCIIPASAFYEWTGEKGDKIPHRISAADRSLLGFAGLWEAWTNPETGEEITSCTIITRDANK